MYEKIYHRISGEAAIFPRFSFPRRYKPMPLPLVPPPSLHGIIPHAMPVDVPPGPYHIPASLYPTLLVILRGHITLHHHGSQSLPPLVLCGATRTPRFAEAAPGTRLLIIPLRHGSLPALCGMEGGLFMESWADWHDLVPHRGRLTALCDILDAGHEMQTVAAVWRTLQELAARQPLQKRLVIPVEALDLPLPALAAHFAVSPRQFERRFHAAYGQSLRAYRHQSRCSRLLPILLASGTTPLADIALQYGFHDQSHMQRDILRFTGQTPASLRRAVTQQVPSAWAYQGMQRHPRLFGSRGF